MTLHRPKLPVEVTETKGIKRATGQVRQGVIQISMPYWWSKAAKKEARDYLIELLEKKEAKENALLAAVDRKSQQNADSLITIDTEAELKRYVQQLNTETLQVPVKHIKIGRARYSRLAQMNIQTQTMTVSEYCLKGVPEAALRYLIVHELAHLIEANHSRRFWKLVSQFVPDYKKQSQIIKAFHKRAVDYSPTSTDNQSNSQPHLEPKLPAVKKPSPQRQQTAIEDTGERKHWWQLKLF